MKRLLIPFVVLIFGSALKAQQDPQYNMYQFNQMIINPGYAGARDVLAAVALHRQQWVGFDGAPVTTCLSVHGPVLKKNLGLGFTVLNDRMGPRNVIAFYGNAAYILRITNKTKLHFGLNGGYNRYQFDFNDIDFKAVEVPTELSRLQNAGTIDLNSGLYLRSSTFFIGLSATHLNNPKVYSYESAVAGNRFTYKLKPHIFFTAGNSFIVNENTIFAPTVMVKLVNGQFGADINLNFLVSKKLWLGAFYRSSYGPGALMQFYFNERLRAGISYDTGLQAAGRLGPSFEAMIGFDFEGAKPRLVNPRFL